MSKIGWLLVAALQLGVAWVTAEGVECKVAFYSHNGVCCSAVHCSDGSGGGGCSLCQYAGLEKTDEGQILFSALSGGNQDIASALNSLQR